MSKKEMPLTEETIELIRGNKIRVHTLKDISPDKCVIILETEEQIETFVRLVTRTSKDMTHSESPKYVPPSEVPFDPEPEMAPERLIDKLLSVILDSADPQRDADIAVFATMLREQMEAQEPESWDQRRRRRGPYRAKRHDSEGNMYVEGPGGNEFSYHGSTLWPGSRFKDFTLVENIVDMVNHAYHEGRMSIRRGLNNLLNGDN